MRISIILFLLATACSSDKQAESSGEPTLPPADKKSAPADKKSFTQTDPAVKQKAPDKTGSRSTKTQAKPSSAQKQAYRKHLRDGRKHAKDKRWGDAVTEFEAAAKAIPGDGRSLSELGGAAFQVGDYKKEEHANADSVRMTSNPKLKAASL